MRGWFRPTPRISEQQHHDQAAHVRKFEMAMSGASLGKNYCLKLYKKNKEGAKECIRHRNTSGFPRFDRNHDLKRDL